jgi:hypothetical protein
MCTGHIAASGPASSQVPANCAVCVLPTGCICTMCPVPCVVRRAEGYQVILLNSNPATIMTDPGTADRTYVGPMTPDLVEQILDKERPDAILPTMGGQTALNLAKELSEVRQQPAGPAVGAQLQAVRMHAGWRWVFCGVLGLIGCVGSMRSRPFPALLPPCQAPPCPCLPAERYPEEIQC